LGADAIAASHSFDAKSQAQRNASGSRYRQAFYDVGHAPKGSNQKKTLAVTLFGKLIE
jgi:hypothetical protein